jgi:hypothetical protein
VEAVHPVHSVSVEQSTGKYGALLDNVLRLLQRVGIAGM